MRGQAKIAGVYSHEPRKIFLPMKHVKEKKKKLKILFQEDSKFIQLECIGSIASISEKNILTFFREAKYQLTKD